MADGVMGSTLIPATSQFGSGNPLGEMASSLRALSSVLIGRPGQEGGVTAGLRAIAAAFQGSPDGEGGITSRLRTAVAQAEGGRELATVMAAAVRAVQVSASGANPSSVVGMAPQLKAVQFAGGQPYTVFPSATVLSLVGLCYNLVDDMPQKFGGMFSTAPYTMKNVPYPASLKATAVPEGVASLDKLIRTTTGPIIVFGYSEGAIVASEWIRQYKSDPTAPGPDRLMFILCGNPLRSTGAGAAIGKVVTYNNRVIGQPTPLDGPWQIIDFARRYDGWADWPADQSNATAVDNAKKGQTVRHMHYEVAKFFDSTHTVWRNGTTTYVLTRELPPNLEKAWYMAPLAKTQIWAKVEQAYVGLRPAGDLPLTVTPTDNWFWKWVLSTMNIND